MRHGVGNVIDSASPALECEIPSVAIPNRRDCLGPEAEGRLRRSGYLALRDVSCEVSGRVAWLRGRLPSYYLKQMAQAVVADVEGVQQVINLIDVTGNTIRPVVGLDRAATGTISSIRIREQPQSWDETNLSQHQPGSR